VADRFDLPFGRVESNYRRLVEDNAASLREDAGVGRAEVDGEVGREGGSEIHNVPRAIARFIPQAQVGNADDFVVGLGRAVTKTIAVADFVTVGRRG
jgi:hypothetical protein